MTDYTTISSFANEMRAEGKPCDHKWFIDEIRENRIPHVTIAGSVYIRKSDLDAAYPRYRESVKKRRMELEAEKAERRVLRKEADARTLEELHDYMRNISSQLHRVQASINAIACKFTDPK